MSKKGQSLHELLEPLREQYFISGEINTKLPSMDAGAGEARRDRRDATRTASSTRWTACRSSIPDWHFNVRPSNTEPLLRLNLEATTPELMAAEARRGARADSRVID